jgi:hypothetical protein
MDSKEGILLLRCGKLTISKLKSSLLKYITTLTLSPKLSATVTNLCSQKSVVV